MNSELLIKCFIAFCIGSIIYKFISDKCSCNIVEGAGESEAGGGPETTGEAGGGPETTGEAGGDPETTGGQETTGGGFLRRTFRRMEETLADRGTTNLEISSKIDNIRDFINNIDETIFQQPIPKTIEKVVKALPTNTLNKGYLDPAFLKISSFYQFGENSDALNYLELIFIEIKGLSNTQFKTFIQNLFSNYCSNEEDLNAYIISMLLLEYYNIDIKSKDGYIHISNTLSKYIPDILDKVQKLNSTCDNPDRAAKSNIMDVMFHKLFKNNNTIINIGSLDTLVQELNKLDRVYGIVILLCITYILVRFLGMFNMKVEV